MRRSFPLAVLRFLLVASALSGGARAVASGEVLVFLLGGQSNGDGRPLASALPASPVDLREPQADIPFYYQSFNRGAGTYTTLRPGSPGEPTPVGQAFGPELAFGREVADWVAAHRPRDRVAIVKYAKGSSSLHTDWKPDGTAETSADGPHYQVFHRTVEKGLAALRADPALAGREIRIAGILWVQGESDTDGSPYERNLRRFVEDIRATYGPAPFVLSSLSMNQTVFSKGSAGAFSAFEGVRRAQREVAATMASVSCVDTDGAEFTVASDRVHFDASGQLALGRALASAAIASLAKQVD